MMMRSTIVILIFTCMVFLGRGEDVGRLVPHLAFVMLNPEGMVGFWSCSGTLISESAVLVHTSCAVIDGHKANRGFVNIGLAHPWTHELPEYTVSITNVTVNDEIAIVHLPQKVIPCEKIRILELTTTNQTGDGVLIGWEERPWRAHVVPINVNTCNSTTKPRWCSASAEDVCVTPGSSFVVDNRTLVAITSDVNYECYYPRRQHYVPIYKYVEWIRSVL